MRSVSLRGVERRGNLSGWIASQNRNDGKEINRVSFRPESERKRGRSGDLPAGRQESLV